MSVVAGLGKAAVAGVLRGARPATRGRVLPKTKWKLMAVAAAPVSSEPQAAPQRMSEKEALDAYEKSFLF